MEATRSVGTLWVGALLATVACTDLAGLNALSFDGTAGAGGTSSAGGAAPGAGGVGGAGGSGASASSGGSGPGGSHAGGAGVGGRATGGASIGGGGAGGGSPTGYPAEVLADNPRAYWRLGETSGTIASDISGLGHDGVYEGNPTLGVTGAIAGDPDTAVAFDGIDDVITVAGDALLLQGTTAFSVELWAIRQDDSSGIFGQSIFTGPDVLDGFMIALANNGSFRIQRQSAQLYPAAPPTGSYFHLVVTYDGVTLRSYIDGQSETATPSSELVSESVPTLILGEVNQWAKLNGTLDEVAVYDHALTLARIQAHYQAAQ